MNGSTYVKAARFIRDGDSESYVTAAYNKMFRM